MSDADAKARGYHHGELRSAALQAGLAILRERGEQRLSMREVAKRVGVTHRALYHWFPDRESLLAALAAQGFSELADAIETALETSSEQPRHSLVRTYIRFARREPEIYRVTMSRDRAERKRHADLAAAIERIVALSASVVVAEESDQRDSVVALWALVHGLVELMSARLLASASEEAFEDWAVGLSDRIGTATCIPPTSD